MAEELKKVNGLDTNHVEDLQTNRTGVEQQEVKQELVRNTPPPAPLTLKQATFMLSIAGIVFMAGSYVSSFTLKTATTPQDHDAVIRLQTQMDEMNKKLDALTTELARQGNMRSYQAGVEDTKARRK